MNPRTAATVTDPTLTGPFREAAGLDDDDQSSGEVYLVTEGHITDGVMVFIASTVCATREDAVARVAQVLAEGLGRFVTVIHTNASQAAMMTERLQLEE